MSSCRDRIAVFIAGPGRFVNYVTKRTEMVLDGHEFDFFFHLWKEDLGNKVRQDTHVDIDELLRNPRTKMLLLESPYSQEHYRESVGLKTNSQSTINATMGMFLSQSLLCNCLAQLPDFRDFKYILRLRTDCAISAERFMQQLHFSPDVLTVAHNCRLLPGQISDHITFGTVENYFALWRFESIEDIYRWYRRGKRNPEQTLYERYRPHEGRVRLSSSLVRYLDYHIVYNPPKASEPQWIRNAISQHGVKKFFEQMESFMDKAESRQLFDSVQRDSRPRALPVRVLRKLRRLLLAKQA